MSKLLVLFSLSFITFLTYGQSANKVLKFDCKAYVFENTTTKKKEVAEGYHLLVIDFNKAKISIYPDSLLLNFVGEVKKHQVDERFFFEFTCIDKLNRTCTANLCYTNGIPEAINISWEGGANIFYFIEKQIQ